MLSPSTTGSSPGGGIAQDPPAAGLGNEAPVTRGSLRRGAGAGSWRRAGVPGSGKGGGMGGHPFFLRHIAGESCRLGCESGAAAP